MRVLFVPCPVGPAHLLPLVALDRMLRQAGAAETGFLVAPALYGYAKRLSVNVLPPAHAGTMRSELDAYRSFRPDVVVDDFSVTTAYAATLWRLPRAAIQRTGMFPFGKAKNPKHRHSLSVDLTQVPDLSRMGLPRCRTHSDLFAAPVKIVPGIPAVEVLPDPVRDDPSYVFAGPLLVEDYLWKREGAEATRDFTVLERFFDANQDRDVVYFTYGLAAPVPAEIMACIRLVLDEGHAVVTSIPVPHLVRCCPERCFHAAYLPMHYVCSRERLAVHHCGSATYHYPLLHGLPSITIGTECFDHDDVATRLEELGASRYLPSPGECDGFVARFGEALHECYADSGRLYQERKAKAAALGREIQRTSAAFDFSAVLETALQA